MKLNRRNFLGRSLLAAFGFWTASQTAACNTPTETKPEGERISQKNSPKGERPLVLSTWNHGILANEAAWTILKKGGYALDAVEAGVKVVEADPESMSVGYGGLPDRDGHVTLDACIMNEKGDAGSVSFLEHIQHPISVARKVMEETPHVMLSGKGALQFALEQGFEKKNLLTDKAKEAWENWKKESQYKPIINVENHDTIGMLALDKQGRISGSCTTSGLAFKMHGRVGDSPIIGAGLFVDGEVGGAVATGLGEMVLKTLGAFLIVELMRNGMSPQEACEAGIRRIIKQHPNRKDFQVGYLALNTQGEYGAYAVQKGFNFALYEGEENRMVDVEYQQK